MAEDPHSTQVQKDSGLNPSAHHTKEGKKRGRALWIRILLFFLLAAILLPLGFPVKRPDVSSHPETSGPRLQLPDAERQQRVRELNLSSAKLELHQGQERLAPVDLALPDIQWPSSPKLQLERSFRPLRNNPWGQGVSTGPSPRISPWVAITLPSEFRGRCSLVQRTRTLQLHGGRAASERAVQSALAWFSEHQNEDGSFGKRYPLAMTSLVLLSFLGHCETPDSPLYGEQVEKMIDYVISQRGKGANGFDQDAGDGVASYSQAMATWALGEAYLVVGDPMYRQPFVAGIQRIVGAQTGQGGWSYEMDGRAEGGNSSLSAWQIQALYCAHLSGMEEVDLDVVKSLNAAMEFLKSVYHRESGSFGYRVANREHPQLAAAATLSLSRWGQGLSKEAHRGMELLLAKTDPEHPWTDPGGRMKYDQVNLYTLFFAVQAAYAQGGRDWKSFNSWFQEALCTAQKADGSWTATAQKGLHQGAGTDLDGTLYRNAINTLILQVYYRYLVTDKLKLTF